MNIINNIIRVYLDSLLANPFLSALKLRKRILTDDTKLGGN